MIQIQNLTLAFGGQVILDRLSWAIKPGRHIGLIGANGAGKTTLLRVLAGVQECSKGTVARPGKVGYLAQDTQENPSSRTVLQEVLQAFDVILDLEHQEEAITRELACKPEKRDKLLARLERIHTQLAMHDASRAEPQAKTVLAGLGFEQDDMQRPLHTLSGGYRMRVALAQILLRKPDVLLLDEPTNHLDILSIDWLESYLKSFPGTVVLVSHDRYFLDRMVTSIAHLSGGKITDYAGNYSFFLAEHEKRRVLQQAAYENQQRQIAQIKRFIERFRYKNTKARQVQSRIRQLEKMELIPTPEARDSAIRVRFPAPHRSGRIVMALSTFSKTYHTTDGPVRVFDAANPLEIERGSKIALVGKNGTGKSTLARILHGTETFEGTRTVGYQVERTFFAQHQAETLNPDHTALEALQEVARGQGEKELRSILGAFLLQGDDVFKPVRVLSGGEKSRVALARTLLCPANLLLLDEPTNHLDIQSIEILIEALKQYTGSFVVVSHDRHFLDQVANMVWHTHDGTVRTFQGTYSEYRWHMEHGTGRQLTDKASTRPPKKVTTKKSRRGGPKTKEQKRLEAEARNQAYHAIKGNNNGDMPVLTPQQHQTLCTTLEASIQEKEKECAETEKALTDPSVYENPTRATAMGATYAKLKKELDTLYEQWAELAQQR